MSCRQRCLLAVAVMLSLRLHAGVPPATSVITVDEYAPGIGAVVIDETDGLCSLREAIVNANDKAATHADCATGGGEETIIILPATGLFTLLDAAEMHPSAGGIGLPSVAASAVVVRIEGNGSRIERDPALGCDTSGGNDTPFRLLHARQLQEGELILEDLELSGGCMDGSSRDDLDGGAIYNDTGRLTLRRVLIADSFSVNSGGAIAGWGPLVIEQSAFHGNGASIVGGALMLQRDTLIRNTTISGNWAEGGGGMHIGLADVFLEHVTLSDNVAEHGANIDGEGARLHSKNTIFDGSGCRELEGALSLDNRDNEHWQAEGTNLDSGSSCAVLFGSNFLTDTDPELQPLANNGGPTPTHALAEHSPARNMADDCTDFEGQEAITVDQRGEPRPGGGACDIGAFELQPGPTIFSDRFESQE